MTLEHTDPAAPPRVPAPDPAEEAPAPDPADFESRILNPADPADPVDPAEAVQGLLRLPDGPARLDALLGDNVTLSLPHRLAILAAAGQVAPERGWLRRGPFAAPASPNGLSALRSTLADAQKERATILSAARYGEYPSDPDALRSPSVRLLRALKAANIAHSWRLDNDELRSLDLTFPPVRVSFTPATQDWRLVGIELSGRDILELVSDAGWCDGGTADFLDRAGIEYTREGSDECPHCGAECEDSDSGSIDYVEDVTLTPRLIKLLAGAGVVDEVQEYLNAGGRHGGGGMVEGLVHYQERTDPETGHRLDGIGRWTIDLPTALETLVGDLDGIPVDELLALGQPVIEEARRWVDAGSLPAFPGTLRWGGRDWSWDPGAETLVSHLDAGDTGDSLSARVTIRTGEKHLILSGRTVALEDRPDGSLVVEVPFRHYGPSAERIDSFVRHELK